MNILRNIFLPFFPNSGFLRKKWWHRMALVFSLILSIVLNLIALLLLINFVQTTAAVPSIIYLILGKQVLHSYMRRDNNWFPEGATPYIDYSGFFLIVILSLIGLFGSNLIYRIILYVVKNNDWKK